jgi:predicted enzyme related to lactoylglutathione lyase
MNLVSMRVITNDMKRLVSFYEDITGLTATWYTEDFAELATPSCTLAIGSTRTMALFGSGAARAADNHSVIIEFRVDDVDQAYASLGDAISDVVQQPKTMPWGNAPCCFVTPTGILSTSSHRSAQRRSKNITPRSSRYPPTVTPATTSASRCRWSEMWLGLLPSA